MKRFFSYLLLWIVMTVSNTVTAQEKEIKVAAIDWTQIETLLALGIEPVGAAQVVDYNAWVKYPKIPDNTADLGLRTQPNLERLSELKPERIFISPMFQSLSPQLSKIAPVTNLPLYKDGEVSWEAIKAYTQTIAKYVHKESEADTLIQSSEERLARLAADLPADTLPLLMVQFMDARHVRVFGDNSMYKLAANQIGLKNAWPKPTNRWGFTLVGIDKLMGIKAQIIVIEPLPAGVKQHLQEDALWQYLVAQTGRPVLTIPPVWSFGAIPSTVRFATLLTSAINRTAH